MTDPRSPHAAAHDALTADELQREERHQRLATLLGAFADGELPAETTSQIDAHLLGCERCRREVQVHRSLRGRLEREPLPAAATSLRDRIIASVAAVPAPQWESVAATAPADVVVEPKPVGARRFFTLGRVVTAVVSVAVLGIAGSLVANRGMAGRDTVVSASSVPLIDAALSDYRRVMRGDLPGRGRDLGAVRDAVSFPVQPLQANGLRLLAAWTTSINGEQTAVLAYSVDDHVLLQYIVPELELYRPAELRSAFADGRLLASRDGAQSVVAWPESGAGSLLVADLPLARMEQLRRLTSR